PPASIKVRVPGRSVTSIRPSGRKTISQGVCRFWAATEIASGVGVGSDWVGGTVNSSVRVKVVSGRIAGWVDVATAGEGSTTSVATGVEIAPQAASRVRKSIEKSIDMFFMFKYYQFSRKS